MEAFLNRKMTWVKTSWKSSILEEDSLWSCPPPFLLQPGDQCSGRNPTHHDKIEKRRFEYFYCANEEVMSQESHCECLYQ